MSANPTTRANEITYQIGCDVVDPLHPEDGYWFHVQNFDSCVFGAITLERAIELFDRYIDIECPYVRAEQGMSRVNEWAYKSDFNAVEEQGSGTDE